MDLLIRKVSFILYIVSLLKGGSEVRQYGVLSYYDPQIKFVHIVFIVFFLQHFVHHFTMSKTDLYNTPQEQSLCQVDMPLVIHIIIMHTVGYFIVVDCFGDIFEMASHF